MSGSPLAVVEYGVGDTLDGGLTKLLHTCPRVVRSAKFRGAKETLLFYFFYVNPNSLIISRGLL